MSWHSLIIASFQGCRPTVCQRETATPIGSRPAGTRDTSNRSTSKTSLSHFCSQAPKVMIFTQVFSVLAITRNAVAKTFSLIKLNPVVCWVNRRAAWLKAQLQSASICLRASEPCGMLCQAVAAAEVFLSKRETESRSAAWLLLCAVQADGEGGKKSLKNVTILTQVWL